MKIITQEARNSDCDKNRADSLLLALRHKKQISLILDICSRCNLNCSFCYFHSSKPQNTKGQEGVMDENLYYKIIEDILKLGYKLKALHFSGWGEPLIQKNISKMINFAHQRGVAEKLVLVTNGVLMDKTIFEQLIASGLDEIRVSLDTADRENYIKMKGRDYLQTVLNNIDYAISRLSPKDKLKFYVKIPGTASDKTFSVSDKDTQVVIDRFKNINNPNVGIILQPLMVAYDTSLLNYKPCEQVFYTALVRFNGNVSPCCLDFKDNLNIGNIGRESLSEILSNEKLRKIRKIHVQGNIKELPCCLHCGFRTALDLSPYAKEIDKLL